MSFRKAYQTKHSLNFLFLVYRVVELSAANIFIVFLTVTSLYKISRRPKLVSSGRINRDRYVSITMLIICLSFVVCYAPFIAYLLFTLFPKVISRVAELLVGQTVLTLLELTSLTNPSIYVVRNKSTTTRISRCFTMACSDFSNRFIGLKSCSGNTTSTTTDINVGNKHQDSSYITGDNSIIEENVVAKECDRISACHDRKDDS